jgi:hypothetical protein
MKPGVTLREERRLGVFESGVHRRILGPKVMEGLECGENCIMRCSIICIHHVLLG